MTDMPPPPGTPPPPGGQPLPPPGGYQQPAAAGWSGPPLAAYGERVVAYLIDYVAPFVAVLIVGFILGAISEALGTVVFLLGYIGAFVFVIWNLVQQGNTGQTIGKKQVGIRLARLSDGANPGVGVSIGRYLLHVVAGFLCGIGTLVDLLWPLWDDKNQTLADKVVSTVVVKA